LWCRGRCSMRDGPRAADFSTMAEPNNRRDYVFVHQWLGLEQGHRVLDVGCGAGLAI
jgi:cyclopropane fatty-acyl-phospholipid synthase-like methyltransferase